MKFQIINKVIPNQSPEDDTGNREYKLYLAHGYVIGQPIEKAAKVLMTILKMVKLHGECGNRRFIHQKPINIIGVRHNYYIV
jgi:hypothetical protein